MLKWCWVLGIRHLPELLLELKVYVGSIEALEGI